MRWTVQRFPGSAQSTPGELTVNGQHFCWTLEPRRDQSKGKPYAIPAGVFVLKVQFSEHFDELVPCVLGVPGFTGIELHPGDFPKDTHGCTLVGFTRVPDFVGESRVAFGALMRALAAYNEAIEIEYLDPPELPAQGAI